MIELECKLRVADLEALAGRLRELGAEEGPRIVEQNTTFDTDDQALFARHGLLRLRSQNNSADGVLTLKRPAGKSRFKVREEIETHIDDTGAMHIILEDLGYRRDFYYEKQRQAWHHRGCTLALDRLPHLGGFLEIEGPDEETILGVLHELRLDPDDHLAVPYRVLWINHCKEHGREVTDWIFDNTDSLKPEQQGKSNP